MREKLGRKQAEEKIGEFFKNIKEKKQEEIKKIKRLAMHHNIKLKEKRKKFCKYCYSSKLRVLGIKNKVKRVECENCGRISRWKV
ncbi:MAG: hypothetical protein AABX71_01210 [Nanoarchaeota archaeon]